MRPNMIFTIEPIFNMVLMILPFSSSSHVIASRERGMWRFPLRIIGVYSPLTGACKFSRSAHSFSLLDSAAQCEHEVLITENGPEVITISGF